jgi:hypothetical protein
MPANSFKFVSPGIFLNEIDNSQVPQLPGAVGPTVIGRGSKGRAMNPINVPSFSDFVDEFGYPNAGGENSEYRASNFAGPTYGAYGAQAYLNANVGPVNFIRLLGVPHPDAEEAGYAGWTTMDYSSGTPTIRTYSSNAGALGLFVAPSESNGDHGTGSLAAVIYLSTGSVFLSGTVDRTGEEGEKTNEVIKITGGSAEATNFTMTIYDGAAGSLVSPGTKLKFNFDRDSNQFIRNVLNTNPVTTNDGVVDPNTLTKNEQVYWLGESYETEVASRLSGKVNVVAWLAPVASGSLSAKKNYGYMLFQDGTSLRENSNIIDARTGWFFAQDLSSDTASYDYSNMTKLFRFHGLDSGEWTQKNIKVSIENLTVSPNADVESYGKFSVVVRSLRDNDTNPIVLERFDNVNLNPSSVDYIGARIGDKTRRFDYSTRTNKEYGQYDNKSRFIRVEVNPAIETGLGVSPVSLPFGVFGPIRPKRVLGLKHDTSTLPSSYISFGSWPSADTTAKILTGSAAFTASIVFPGTAQRVSASDGGITDTTRAYFGARTTISATSNRFDSSVPDTLRLYGTDDTYQNIGLSGLDSAAPYEHHWIFSLDDVVIPSNSTAAYYLSGSRIAGTSRTATSGGYTATINAGFTRFTALFQGGSDGLNIQEAEPFQYNRLNGATKTNSAVFNALEVAVDLASDPDMLETNMIVVPGIRNSAITDKVITACENRGDAFTIIDIDDGYDTTTESTQSFKNRLGTVSLAITNLRSRRLNTSYACAYYPWVQIRDPRVGSLVWVPPSVVALGTMASSERVSEVWFAPAGFNRGGLTAGAGGLPVVNVAEKLTVKQRDDLYQANINPIASFPSEGIVIFGQKTLQVTPSALDRINVRRLLIYIKKQVSRFATSILFDQNVSVTWNRFKAAVEPFLASVQSRLGLTEYRLILDESTTTPDLIDRNVLYAKILLKPAKAIEFIAVDFVISRTGASFED